MTVRELIQRLQEEPDQDLKVLVELPTDTDLSEVPDMLVDSVYTDIDCYRPGVYIIVR